jgi:hypothetical protein
MPESDFEATLRALHASGVDFILVGGLAAVLNGAPVNTFDVDIVHSREPANIERLLMVLDSLDATFRIQPERRIRPALSHLAGTGHLNLITKFGPLDVLGAIGRDLDYGALLQHSSQTPIADGIKIRVLDLETLVAIKEDLGNEKDRSTLPVLRRALEEERRRRAP